MNMRKIAFILVALIAQALSAASNPEPVEIECSRHEAKSCGRVIAKGSVSTSVPRVLFHILQYVKRRKVGSVAPTKYDGLGELSGRSHKFVIAFPRGSAVWLWICSPNDILLLND